MYSEIKKYLKKLLLFSIPFFIFLGWYIVLDPFEVIWHYDDYFKNRGTRLSLNHGYVAVSNFENHYDQYRWDSFIFGNSRSRYWEIKDWEEVLPANSRGYHFDASGETLEGLLRKFQWLEKKNITIKNVLICMDTDILSNVNSSDERTHIFMIPPQLVGYRNFFDFQMSNFKVFCNFEFLRNCFVMWFTPDFKIDIADLVTGEIFDYDYSRNQVSLTPTERKISKGEYYTDELVNRLFVNNQYPDSIYPVTIDSVQREMLGEIASIVKRNNTDCRIVINPRYNQIKMHPKDVMELKSLFGTNKVYDYSGVNNITNDYHNYYEYSHYRSFIAKKIMHTIYRGNE